MMEIVFACTLTALFTGAGSWLVFGRQAASRAELTDVVRLNREEHLELMGLINELREKEVERAQRMYERLERLQQADIRLQSKDELLTERLERLREDFERHREEADARS